MRLLVAVAYLEMMSYVFLAVAFYIVSFIQLFLVCTVCLGWLR